MFFWESKKYEKKEKELTNNKNQIGFLISKNIPKSLSIKFKMMKEEEKANLYFYIGEKIYLAAFNAIFESSQIYKLATKYIERALAIMPDNIKYAYKLFDVYDGDDFGRPNEDGVKAAEHCLELSGYKDTENKFADIYSYLGLYYYSEKQDYFKALDYYKKVQNYSNKNDFLYLDSKYRIAIIYKSLGYYKKALEELEELEKYEKFNKVDENDYVITSHEDYEKMKCDLIIKVKNGITKEQEDERIFKGNMNYVFKECVNKYPEVVLVEAYKHYLRAEELLEKEQRQLEAIEEYKKVKEIVPEKTVYIDNFISDILFNSSTKSNDKNKHNEELLNVLNERLKIISMSGMKKDLSNIYNEMAIVYSDMKNYKESIENFKNAIKHAGYASVYAVNLAKCYVNLDLYDEAIDLYKKIMLSNRAFAKEFVIEQRISMINEIKLGKRGKNGEDYSKAIMHSKRGDDYVSGKLYHEAFGEYESAYRINGNKLEYYFKVLNVMEMEKEPLESIYLGNKKDVCLKALLASVEKDEFKYLPYLFFILADFSYDKDLEGKQRESAIFYELAIYLLDIVPNNEKFADPYYKLAKLKERENKFEEAITLYKFAGTIDKSYNVEKDIKRVTSLYEGGGNTDDEGEDNDREMPLIDFF